MRLPRPVELAAVALIACVACKPSDDDDTESTVADDDAATDDDDSTLDDDDSLSDDDSTSPDDDDTASDDDDSGSDDDDSGSDDDDSGSAPPCAGALVGELGIDAIGQQIVGAESGADFGWLVTGLPDSDSDEGGDVLTLVRGTGSLLVLPGAPGAAVEAGDSVATLAPTRSPGPYGAVEAQDLTEDGVSDLLIVEQGWEPVDELTATVFLLAGPPTTMALDETHAAFLAPDQEYPPFDLGPCGSYSFSPFVTHNGPRPWVSGAGDATGDGVPDIVVGGWMRDIVWGYGKVYLFAGPFEGEYQPEDAVATITGLDPCTLTGWPVALPGDLDGDGVGDVVIGERESDAGGPFSGAVYGFSGPLAGDYTTADADWALLGGDYNRAGWRVVGGSDLTGDGIPDLVVSFWGSCLIDTDDERCGGAYVVPGPMSGTASLAEVAYELETDAILRSPYLDIAVGGDFNADGQADLVLGDRAWPSDWNTTVPLDGIAYVIYGPVTASRSLAAADLRLLGSTSSLAGFSVDFVPDTDGDGTDEIVVGAPYDSDSGAVYIVRGQPCSEP